jgi:competence protein ComEC
VLVDEGPPEADVAGQLRRLGVRSLSAIVLTHPQRDHIGGAARVVERLDVGAVAEPGIEAPSPDREAVLAAARRRGVPVVVVHSDEVFDLGKLEVRILWPDDPGPPGEDPNQHAVVALVTYGATDVLLTADAESDVTSRLHLHPVEVLKVAHHGSEDPGLPDLLRVLRPRIAVISVAAHNDYDHPRPETLAALAAEPGLRTLRTDVNGRIVLESDGRTLTVRSER